MVIFMYVAQHFTNPHMNTWKNFYLESWKLHKYTINEVIKIAYFFDAAKAILNPWELDKNKNHVVIFDDVMLNDQTEIEDYFWRRRHDNVNVFYLCQSLHKIA